MHSGISVSHLTLSPGTASYQILCSLLLVLGGGAQFGQNTKLEQCILSLYLKRKISTCHSFLHCLQGGNWSCLFLAF